MFFTGIAAFVFIMYVISSVINFVKPSVVVYVDGRIVFGQCCRELFFLHTCGHCVAYWAAQLCVGGGFLCEVCDVVLFTFA